MTKRKRIVIYSENKREKKDEIKCEMNEENDKKYSFKEVDARCDFNASTLNGYQKKKKKIDIHLVEKH